MRAEIDLRLLGDDGIRAFGPGPFDLLSHVRETHSLSSAASEAGMSYSKALSVVRTAEEGLGFRLLDRRIGGPDGGGSWLTPEAEDMLDRYQVWDREVRSMGERLVASVFAGVAGMPRVGCVVMASGEARRFGAQKLLEPLCVPAADDAAATPCLLEQNLSRVPTDAVDLVVASRWPQVQALCDRLGVRWVEPEGPLQSDTLRAGLAAFGDRSGCLFLPADQPLVSPESIRAVARQLSLAPGAIARLGWQGRAGSPMAFPAELFGALAALQGDVGGSALLARPELAARVRLVEAERPEELLDVDTPDDLDRVREILGAEAEDGTPSAAVPAHDAASRGRLARGKERG